MEEKIKQVNKVVITTLLENHSGFEPNFIAQHGVSFLIEVTVGKCTKRILFDTGPSAEAVACNMKNLEVKPDTIDMIALSHCHYDHTGGLVGILKEIQGQNIPILAHPSLFDVHLVAGTGPKPRNWLTRPIGMIGENTEENIRTHGGFLTLVTKPFELMPGVLWAGEIDRVTDFEKTPTLVTRIIRDGEILDDPIIDDTALAINVAGAGLFVVSGCSHSGIVNIVKQCIKFSQVKKVKAVIGGFHLLNASEDRIGKTIRALKELHVENIYSGHCTGFKAQAAIYNEFGDAFEELYAGKVIRSDP